MERCAVRKSGAMLGALVLCAAVVAGCGSGSDRLGISTRRDRGTLLYLGSRSSITALSPTSGSVRFEEAGAVPSRDWSVLYATANHGTSTTLRELDARTGDTLSTREMPGTFVVRTVSDNGGIVVLAPPNPNGNDAYHPYPKSQTELMIARRGDSEVQHMTVDGNVEPEAISLSGKALFVIDFIPPLAPERYRVARLDLESGRVGEVRSDEDELQKPMRGTARAQVMAPDGRRLFTLYTRDATDSAPAESFVHVLDLEHEKATCVDLPPEFASSGQGAIAVTPSGTHVYVAATGVGALAEVEVATLSLTRTATFPVDPLPASTSRATATETTLYLATDARVTAIDLKSLSVGGEWTAPDTVTGIELSRDGAELYLSLADRVLVVDPRTLQPRKDLPVSSTEPIDHVAPALPPIDNGYVKCAC